MAAKRETFPFRILSNLPIWFPNQIEKGRFRMNKRTLLDLLMVLSLVVGLLAFVTGAAVAQEMIHWTYEGEEGPEHWGELSPDYAACVEGLAQSPVDIPASAPVNAADITFNYQPTALNILNNGHTIQVNYDAGSSIEMGGKTYNLRQFHFHALSEHTMSGQHSDLEMHLVHQSDDGSYAVVGVMMQRGADNSALAPVWNNLPTEESTATVEGVTVNAADLLPAERSYYHYDGSFTTPPCTEGVNWLVLSTPIDMSDAQAAAFEQIYNNNYRPVQPLNARSFMTMAQASPATLPATGGHVFSIGLIWLGLGSLSLAGGLYLYRRKIV
jgi:carbonic anhydrase